MTIRNNDLKKYSSLNRKNKRKEHQLFVVEGEKICKELIKNDFEYESIFTTKDLQNEFPLNTKTNLEITFHFGKFYGRFE